MNEELKSLMDLINGDGILFSLLYDLDLLPEQVKENSPEWSQMILIAAHWKELIKREKQSQSKEGEIK